MVNERELVGRHDLFLAAKPDGLPDEEARDVRVRRPRAHLVRFSVRKVVNAKSSVQTKALPRQQVDLEFGAAPQPVPAIEI
jgi:hypothetical protein